MNREYRIGLASAEATTVIELPAGAAAGVREGDRVEVGGGVLA